MSTFKKIGGRYGMHSGSGKFKNSEIDGAQFVNVTQTIDNVDYTLKDSDFIVNADTTSGVQTITIPTSLCVEGRIIIINDWGGNAATYEREITVATEGSETIDGAADATIDTYHGTLGLYSDGSNWFTY